MLRHIIPSDTRIKILELFFHNPDKTYYLRKVVREVEKEVNAVKRELDILEEEKVLLKEKRLNKVFYSLNKNYILYEEFLRIFTKTDTLASLIYQNFTKLGKIKFIAISFNYAKRKLIKEDEVYLFIVGSIVVPEITNIVSEAEKEFGSEINYTVMTEDEFVFRKKNNDPFVWRFLKQPKVMLTGSEDEFLK
jgi:DNA-binding transcriptional ArsR family regulator